MGWRGLTIFGLTLALTATIALDNFARAQSNQLLLPNTTWEVDTPPGSDPFYALRAIQAPSASDLHSIEYLPKLSVLCKKGSIGPYGHGSTNYKSLKVKINWGASNLPKEFETLASFLRTGIDPHAADPRGNTVWVNFGRAWTASGGFVDLIKVGNDDSSPIETVKITGIPKGFGFSAEILDGNQAEAFLKAFSSSDQIPVVIHAQANDLSRAVELRGMKPAVDKVLSFCGRDPL
jgi:hypothetical protein